jgi:hypothetical protein
MIKYGNPVNEEVTPDMIKDYVSEIEAKFSSKK